MKADFVIDEKLLEEAIKITGLKTKQEVIELGLKTLIKLKQQEKIKPYRGNLKWEDNLEEIILDASELVETLKGIKLGLEQMQKGQGKKVEEFFKEIEQEIGNLLQKRHRQRDEVLARIRQRVEALPIEAESRVQTWKSAGQC